MKEKQKKLKNKKFARQIIEIHVYVHALSSWGNPPNQIPTNPIINPPWIVTC